jgi:hypothetical protein
VRLIVNLRLTDLSAGVADLSRGYGIVQHGAHILREPLLVMGRTDECAMLVRQQ